eukprot:7449544-Lingulodinium_polyedra.AAC.1
MTSAPTDGADLVERAQTPVRSSLVLGVNEDPCSRPTVHCSLFTLHCPLSTVHCALLTVHCAQSTAHS